MLESFASHFAYILVDSHKKPSHASREDPLPRCPLLLLIALLTTPLMACDQVGDIIFVPEFDLSYSFEGGLDGWFGTGVDLADPIVTWSVEASSEQASSGASAARLSVDNINGMAKVWMQRAATVEPSVAYDVDITFDFGTSDFGEINLWRILAGAHTGSPGTAAALTVRDATGNGSASNVGVQWLQKSYRMRAVSDPGGRIQIVLGVWGTFETARTYYIDNVRLLFTRAS